jgi:cell division protein FtsB
MDFDDLVGFEEEDVGPLACYVCGTAIDVIKQDVITSVEPLETVTLPVCSRCSNAVGTVLTLEDDFEKVVDANGALSMRAILLAALLDEGRQIVVQLQEQVAALAGRNAMLEVENFNLRLDVSGLNDEAEALYTDNASLCGTIDDLEKRIEAGAGLNDVELTIIPSADYED